MILDYTSDGREFFLRDQRTIDAVVRCFEIIGEAARHVPEDVRLQAPGIPWREVSSFRNFLIHVYDSVHPDKVWVVVERDVPVLLREVEGLLNRLGAAP